MDLGIILQFGNRLNTAGNRTKGKAGGFSLESLSKLTEAKAFDRKTTFLHYIILIVQRNNELLLKFYDDIPTVMESDSLFWDQCQQDLEEVENQLENVRRISLHEARSNGQSQSSGVSDDDSLGHMELTLEEEVVSLRATPTGLFTLGAIKQVSALREKIEQTKKKCLQMKEYFGVTNRDTEPQEIFSAFVVFTRDFQKAKKQVFSTAHKRLREDRKKARQRTPNKPPKSIEPEGSGRAPPSKGLMRASSHQPNMSQLFGDIQKRKNSSGQDRSREDNAATTAQNGRQSSSAMSTPSSRAGLLSSIKERQSPSESNDPRAGLLNSIKQRKEPLENDRAGLLNSIKQRQPSAASDDPSSSRAGLLDAIKKVEPLSENKRPSVSENSMAASNTTRHPLGMSFNDTELQNRNDVSKQATPLSSNASIPSQDTSRTESARDTMRQKAFRNQKSYSNPRLNTSADEANSSQAQPSPVAKPISTRSPRDAMRNHRRRMAEAIRVRNANNATNVAQGTE